MKKSWIKGVLLLLTLFLLLSIKTISTLEVSSGHELLWWQVIKTGDIFDIQQSHSLSMTQTTDRFIMKSGMIYHYAITFEDQGGAGLPDVFDPSKLFFKASGEFLYIINKKIDLPINCLVNKNYDWKLLMKNQTYETEETFISITTNKISFLKLITLKIRRFL